MSTTALELSQIEKSDLSYQLVATDSDGIMSFLTKGSAGQVLSYDINGKLVWTSAGSTPIGVSGLSNSGANIRLGGTLAQDAIITTSGNNVKFVGSSSTTGYVEFDSGVLYSYTNLGNFTVNTSIPSASLLAKSFFLIAQTTSNIAISLPTSGFFNGRVLYFVKSDNGTNLTVNGYPLTNNNILSFVYNGVAFIPLNVPTTFTTVEVNLGNTPVRNGSFNITSTGLTTGKQVMINQASGPYTSKGTLSDESEMDSLTVNAVVTSATNIKCYWNSQTFVKGNFKFNYLINN